MVTSRTILLDCGASRTALGVFSRQGDRLRLEEYAVENFPVTAGADDQWREHTGLALRALRTRFRANGPVALILPAHLVLTKLVKTPRVETTQRAKVIRFEAEQSIPYALSEVVWDSVVAGERNSDLEVLLAAAKLDAVGALCTTVQAAGFEPQLLLPSPLATLAAFRLVRPRQERSSLVLNLGARSTTLLLVTPKRFVARTLPFGGSSITAQFAGNQECGAMETLATRLAQEITRSVLHFRRQSEWESPASVHLTGGGARLNGLAEALAAKLKIPVERFDALGAVELAAGATGAEAAGHALMLTDLIGAAAAQLLPDQAVLNLLPPTLSRRENHRRRQPGLIFAAVMAVMALIPPVLHYRNVTAEARRKTAALELALAPLRARDARNRTNLAQLAELGGQAAQLQGILDRRASWLNLLADLQDRLGKVGDVWLDKLLVMPGATGTPVKLVITGRMIDRTNPLSKVSPETFGRVKTLLAGIVDSPFVAGVEGERFDNHQPGILRFDFVLVTDPAHPL